MFENKNMVEMHDEEFLLIRDFIYDHCGLFFETDSKYLLEKRLSGRIALHQISSYRDYYLYLKYDRLRDEELSTVLDLLTTNETYFFREGYQLKAFTEEIVPEITGRKREKVLRIWSAGCSTGEEPYTIAMMLVDLMKNGVLNGWHIEILGSDISQRVLGVARKGAYSPSSFRETDKRYMSYFEEDDGKKRIKDEVRKLVTFTHLNLLDSSKISLLKTMDVIFCRNVIIYFDIKAKKRVMQEFYDRLDKGGYLLLGHSESLMNISALFDLKHLKNDMVYQKPFAV
ncbi:MAG: protein-glutamate O-methyltransferase CheR [Deltaproteobacteria bacterium]